MIGGFTVFGFDLFGISQRKASLQQGERKEAVSDKGTEVETETEDETRPEPSEIFFWGMYPVY